MGFIYTHSGFYYLNALPELFETIGNFLCGGYPQKRCFEDLHKKVASHFPDNVH
jgi:hypothetical protein